MLKLDKLGKVSALVMAAKCGTSPVEKEADGTIKAFRVLKFGELSITQPGKLALSTTFTPEEADVIIAAHAAKGAKIPIDSEHTLFYLAEKMGKTESEVAAISAHKTLPMAYCDLEKRTDGLWACKIDWTEPGKAIAASGVLRYHSPVLRGINTDQSKVSSVALTTNPAINHLDAIACGAEVEPPAVPPENDDDDDDAKIQLSRIAKMLGLDDDADPSAIVTALEVMIETLKETKAQADTLAASAKASEEAEKEAWISRGLATGQVTNATASKIRTLPLSAVRNFMEILPVGGAVKIGQTVAAAGLPNPGCQKSYTDAQKRAMRAAGLTDAQITQAENGQV